MLNSVVDRWRCRPFFPCSRRVDADILCASPMTSSLWTLRRNLFFITGYELLLFIAAAELDVADFFFFFFVFFFLHFFLHSDFLHLDDSLDSVLWCSLSRRPFSGRECISSSSSEADSVRCPWPVMISGYEAGIRNGWSAAAGFSSSKTFWSTYEQLSQINYSLVVYAVVQCWRIFTDLFL